MCRLPPRRSPCATLAVCDSGGLSGNSTGALCQDIPLTVPLVASLFTSGLTNPTVSPNQGLPANLSGWADPRLHQAGGQPIPDYGIDQASTLEPSAENSALMALLDSDPTAKELLDNALEQPGEQRSRRTVTRHRRPGPSTAFMPTSAEMPASSERSSTSTRRPMPRRSSITWGGLGAGTGVDDVFPLSSVWAGAPEGTPWNIPTAAIQNAAGKYVAASETAAAASEADATMDPTTNLVTFAANASDAAAYNSYLMVESYLVVPTSGLTPAKAQKLAQYIRFVVGSVAASDEETLGSAPPTPSMVAADLKVATELDGEHVASAAATSTTSTTSPSSTTSTTSTTTTTAPSNAASGSTAAATGNSGSGTGLASTGASNVVPVLAVGGALVAVGAFGRRRSRRLRRSEVRP